MTRRTAFSRAVGDQAPPSKTRQSELRALRREQEAACVTGPEGRLVALTDEPPDTRDRAGPAEPTVRDRAVEPATRRGEPGARRVEGEPRDR